MNPFFVYLIKSSVSLTLFYIVFRLAMSRDKNHSLNRFLLLGILFVSSVIPLLNFQFFTEETIIQPVSAIRDFISAPVEIQNFAEPEIVTEAVKRGIQINSWLLLYSFVIIGLLTRILVSVARVLQILRKSEKKEFKKIVIAVIKEVIQPFSFLKYIIISEKDYIENWEVVITHEHEHIRQLHSIDLVVCEIFTAIYWFNPFIWLLRRDLKLIHEYQADQAVLNNGIDEKKYQLLVLEKAVGERRFALANNFTQKPILKRLKMMKKKKTNRWGLMKLLLFLPMGFLLLMSFSKPDFVSEVSNKIAPVLKQQDSTEIWLKKWTIDNLEAINGGLKTRQVIVPGPPFPGLKVNAPMSESQKGTPIKMRNILVVLINSNTQFMVEKHRVQKDNLLEAISKFLDGKDPYNDNGEGPEFIEKELPLIGQAKVSKGVISFRYDLGSNREIVESILQDIGKMYLNSRT